MTALGCSLCARNSCALRDAHARTARSAVLRDRLAGSCCLARNVDADDGPVKEWWPKEVVKGEEERKGKGEKFGKFLGKIGFRALLS